MPSFLIKYGDLTNIVIENDPPEGTTSGDNEIIVTEEAALITLPSATLVAIYNSIRRGAAIKDFHTRQVGAARIWVLLQAPRIETPPPAALPDTPDQPPAETQETTDMARTKAATTRRKSKTAAKPKVKRETSPAKREKRKAAEAGPIPRPGTKKAKLLSLVSRENGATMTEMLNATGWKACLGTAAQVAKAAGLTLTIVKAEGKVNRWVAK